MTEMSLLDRSIRRLGAKRTRELLRTVKVREFAPDVPEEWATRSAADVSAYLWQLNGRPSQLIGLDGPHRIVLVRSGRGWGKSRCGAETVNLVAQRLARLVQQGQVAAPARIILCGRSESDVRDVMIGGANGVVARSGPWFRARHEPGRRRVIWGDGVVEALTYSASEPSQTRGPSACFCWTDETATYGLHIDEVWNNLELATREGPLPTKLLVTTTPRAIPWIRALITRPDVRDIQRPTADNEANLSAGLVAAWNQRFGGAVAAQELRGEIVDLNSESWFPPESATILSAPPDDIVAKIRSWDFAATKPSEVSPDPDWTAGVLLGKRRDGRYVVLDARLLRDGPGAVEDLVAQTADMDGQECPILIPIDPGAAGKSAASALARRLAGYTVVSERPTGSKESRATAFSSQWMHGNVDVLRGAWNPEFLRQLSGFPGGFEHDDCVDSAASGFNNIANKERSMFDVDWGEFAGEMAGAWAEHSRRNRR